MNKKKYSKKELKQQLTKLQTEKLSLFLLALDNSNNTTIKGWSNARFDKTTFLKFNNDINNLPSNIRIFFSNTKNVNVNIQAISNISSLIPLYLYKDNNIFLKHQMSLVNENSIVDKLTQQLSLYKKLFFLFKARSAKII
jgi:hypothetical protein